MTLNTGRCAVLLLLAGSLLAGCNGVQAGHKVDDCDAINKLRDIKLSMDTVDRKILNLRPDPVTVESIKGLVGDYRQAESTYQGLLAEATTELDRSRSKAGAAPDLVKTWERLVESLTERRDGIHFFADVFSDPASLARDFPSFSQKTQELLRKQGDVNARLQAQMTATLKARGFKQRGDGQFAIDC